MISISRYIDILYDLNCAILINEDSVSRSTEIRTANGRRTDFTIRLNIITNTYSILLNNKHRDI